MKLNLFIFGSQHKTSLLLAKNMNNISLYIKKK